jgi:hypothetical protein
MSTTQAIYLIRIDESRGISMSPARRAAWMRNDAVIAFVLFCLIGLFLFGALASAVIFAIAP